MSQRRYSTRLEKEEAVVVASLEFWDRLSDYLFETAESDEKLRDLRDNWMIESSNHIDQWVERTRFKHKDER